jgi:addiction module HigA family antidote
VAEVGRDASTGGMRGFSGRTVSVTDAAKHLGVTRVALSRILNGRAGVSADMALKLSDALGTSPELWIGMQTQYDLWRASQHRHKRVTPLFVGAGHRRLGKPLPKSGGTIRARAVQGRSTRNAAVARP